MTQKELVVQPDGGVEAILQVINAATRSLRIKQFSLTEPRVIAGLIERHRQGIQVEVMLNPHRSEGERVNDLSAAALKQAGVNVEWTNPAFQVTHEKSAIVDEEYALIATFNLARKFLAETRDYGVVTTDPRQVGQISQCFDADWHREPFTPDTDTGLLWSTGNSRELMANFIDSAKNQLLIQHPKLADATILERIVEARMRGVEVRILSGGKHGIDGSDLLDTFSSLRILAQLGIKIRRQRHPKLHTKLMILDRKRAIVGSMNISRTSFDLRRELGIILDRGPTVEQLLRHFKHDWRKAKPYAAPDPLRPDTHDEGELPHDPDFIHA
ncbi:MAG: phospholipase D-like domain-containing protein [Pseudomonadota bacterium]